MFAIKRSTVRGVIIKPFWDRLVIGRRSSNSSVVTRIDCITYSYENPTKFAIFQLYFKGIKSNFFIMYTNDRGVNLHHKNLRGWMGEVEVYLMAIEWTHLAITGSWQTTPL